MTPEHHIVIPLSVTVVVAIASFIVGFLVNMLAMRALFVSARQCDECRDQCAKRQETMIENVERELKELKDGQKRIDDCIFRMHGEIQAIASRFRTRGEDNGWVK